MSCVLMRHVNIHSTPNLMPCEISYQSLQVTMVLKIFKVCHVFNVFLHLCNENDQLDFVFSQILGKRQHPAIYLLVYICEHFITN